MSMLWFVAIWSLAVNSAFCQIDFNGRLIFQSDFANNTLLLPISPSLYVNTYQQLQGMSPGLAILNADPLRGGLHAIVTAGGSTPEPTNNYIFNSVETVVGPSGDIVKALKMAVLKPSPKTCCTQDVLQTVGITASVRDLYQRMWLKLNPEMPAQVQASKNKFWRAVWAMKTRNDYRIEAYIYGNLRGQPYWYVHGDNVGGSDMRPPNGIYQEFWSAANTTEPVPLDQWFSMEIYLRRSNDSDGRFYWAVNGQTLADRRGPNYGVNREQIDLLAHALVYGDAENLNPAYQWIYGLEVWDRPPCESLPCGMPTQ